MRTYSTCFPIYNGKNYGRKFNPTKELRKSHPKKQKAHAFLSSKLEPQTLKMKKETQKNSLDPDPDLT